MRHKLLDDLAFPFQIAEIKVCDDSVATKSILRKLVNERNRNSEIVTNN